MFPKKPGERILAVRQPRRRIDRWLGLFVACCLCSGCGSSVAGRLPTAEVSGHVTYQGKPLTQGIIKFIPIPGAAVGSRVAIGQLDSQGCYRLGTYSREDGAILGDHQVTIESRAAPSDTPGRPLTRFEQVRTPTIIPERYSDPSRSLLTARVAVKSNTIDFDLKD